MIVILGTLVIEPTQVAEFEAAAAPLVAATRSEAGCNHYHIARDVEVPGMFHVVEEWATGDAVAAHLASAHFTEFRQALAGIDVHSRRVVKYDVSAATPL